MGLRRLVGCTLVAASVASAHAGGLTPDDLARKHEGSHARTTIKRQKLAFIIAPFVDAGRTFARLADLAPRGWFSSVGGAFRISWNLATLVTFDYGFCREGSGAYVNFGHTF